MINLKLQNNCNKSITGNIQSIFLKKYVFIFRERGEEGESRRDTHVGEEHRSVASCTCPAWDLARSPGCGPDQESDW